MKNILNITAAGGIAVALFILPCPHAFAKKKASPAPAASASPAAAASASPSASPAARKVRTIPFHGMISSVDQKAKTFTIAGKVKSRTFRTSEYTTVTRNGKPASVKDIAEKEEVRGNYWKETDGSLQAKTVKLGPPTPEEKAAEDAQKAHKAQRKERKAAKAAAAASSASSPAASATASPAPSAKP